MFPAGGIAEGEHHGHAGVVGGALLESHECAEHFLGQACDFPDHAQADVVLHKELVLKAREQEAHERGHLVGGAVPVFGGKGVERQEAHTEVGGGRCDFAHGFHAFLVAHAAVLSTCLCPASVAVHDDGHVGGDAFRIDLLFQCHSDDGVVRPRAQSLLQVGHLGERS